MKITYIFSLAFIVTFATSIFLFAEIEVERKKLNQNVKSVTIQIGDKISKESLSLGFKLENFTTTFSQKLYEFNKTAMSEGQLLNNLTETYEEKLDKTITKINKTINEETKSVNDKVLNLTTNVGNYVNTTTDQFNSQGSLMAFQFAGTFTILGVLIFMYHTSIHMRHFNEPFVQRKILAMLWMVPIYCITSFCSLVFVSAEGYLAIVKDFYEGYCIYMFLSFLIAVLGRGNRVALVSLLAKHGDRLKPPIHFFGLCGKTHYENNREKANAALWQYQIAALQFVFLRPITSICMVTANAVIDKDISIWNFRYPQFYINLVMNISVFLAFSGLLRFYHAVRDELEWCQPFPKFLCIKGVVFMTFWQGLVISLIANSLFEDDVEGGKNWSLKAQNFLICLEMFFFSVVHLYVFPPEEWEEGYRPAEAVRRKFGDNIALRDFVQDVKTVLKSSTKRKKSSRGEESNLSRAEEKVNTLYQFEDEDDLTFINRIMKEADGLKLEEEKEIKGSEYEII